MIIKAIIIIIGHRLKALIFVENFYQNKFVMKNKIVSINLNYIDDFEATKSRKIIKILEELNYYDIKICEYKLIKDKRYGQYLIITLNDNSIEYISYSSLNSKGGRNTYIEQGFILSYIHYLKNTNLKKTIKILYCTKQDKLNPYNDYVFRIFRTLNINIINPDWYSNNNKELTSFNNVFEIQNFKSKIGRKNNNPTTLIREENKNYLYAKFDGTNENGSMLLMMVLNYFKNGIIRIVYKDEKIKLSQKFNLLFKELKNIKIIEEQVKISDNKFITTSKTDKIRNQVWFSLNLLLKYKEKKCLICDCEIESLIQACHIYPIAKIKKSDLNTKEQKIYAIDPDNGLWMCSNHHKLFDNKKIIIDESGSIIINKSIEFTEATDQWIRETITKDKIESWNDNMNKFNNLSNQNII